MIFNHSNQLIRFCLYGFLKNLQFFDPFLILAFREKGLSFTEIGVLIAFRAICVNAFEIPSGAIADILGRRRSMVASMLGYITSFVFFALASEYWVFFPAMLAFAVGEAFRTGTHKAMIFDWLKQQGRQDEKTRIYGMTRSWSKIGSALNVIIAAALVICMKSYVWVFWFSIIPYILNIVNFTFYPSFLDGAPDKKRDLPEIFRALKRGVGICLKRASVRSLIAENICFEGYYFAARDYLQPLLKAAALGAPILLSVADKTRTAVLVAVTYVILNLLSSVASRKSHRAAELAGGEVAVSGWILGIALVLYAFGGTGMWLGIGILPIAVFILLAVVQNVWKPVFVSRFYDCADEDTAATTLSVANQSKTLAVSIFAPALGLMVDQTLEGEISVVALWPVAACGIGLSLIGLWIHYWRHGSDRHTDHEEHERHEGK